MTVTVPIGTTCSAIQRPSRATTRECMVPRYVSFSVSLSDALPVLLLLLLLLFILLLLRVCLLVVFLCCRVFGLGLLLTVGRTFWDRG